MYSKLKLYLFLFLLSTGFAQAQVSSTTNNPYSAFGIGELQPLQSVRNSGMAGTGMAFSDKEYLNIINPALLSRTRQTTHVVARGETIVSIAKTYSISEEEIRVLNKIVDEPSEGDLIKIPFRKYTKFEGAVSGGYRNVNSNFGNYSNKYFNYQHFILALPISQRLSAAIGLTPISETQYAANYEYTLPNGTSEVKSRTNTNGGLNHLFASAGYDVSKNLSLGFQTGLVFGKINHEQFYQFKPADTLDFGTPFGNTTETHYTGFSFKPSFFYTTSLNGSADSSLFLNIGSSLEFFSDVRGKEDHSFQNRGQFGTPSSDSTITSSTKYSNLPKTLSFGVALQKLNRWTIGGDLSYGDWSEIASYQSDFTYTNSYRISIGGEAKFLGKDGSITPKTPSYRLGMAMAQLPYLYNGSNIYDYSVSLGASIPVARLNPADKNQPLAKIQFAITTGLQGNKNLAPGREFYINLSAGVLINDKWFTRRRIQ
jgi:hypothetical protein